MANKGDYKEIGAANTFTDWVNVMDSASDFNFLTAIGGTWAGTVTVQLKREGEADSTAWDVKTYTANDVEKGSLGAGGLVVRAGFKTGEYTSGTANILVKSQ